MDHQIHYLKYYIQNITLFTYCNISKLNTWENKTWKYGDEETCEDFTC